MKRLNSNHTLIACCSSSVVQAITNNVSPLLFVVFRESLGISLGQLSILITLNFCIQIGVDLLASLFVDRLGYRRCILIAEALATVGMISLGVLPRIMPSKFAGLLIATVINALGGGLTEVVSSPIVEAMPSDAKARCLSLLHSFYCWGHAAVILLSTLFFAAVGIDSWYYLPAIWSIVPLLTFIMFLFVPIGTLADGAVEAPVRSMLKSSSFWLLLVVMICAGASELSMAQWASLFAEKALGVSKTVGDLIGPCAFAICMGVGRILLSIFGDRVRLEKWLLLSFVICAVSYLTVALSPKPYISLIFCAVCGVGAAILWPATLTTGQRHLPGSGTAMFALFALAGDVGCTLGPDVVGIISDTVVRGNLVLPEGLFGQDPTTVGMKLGMLLATVFPVIAIIALIPLIRKKLTKD